MLDLVAAPDVPASLAEDVTRHGRAAGLSLVAIEAVLASLPRAEGFILAAETGWGDAYADALVAGKAPVAPFARYVAEVSLGVTA